MPSNIQTKITSADLLIDTQSGQIKSLAGKIERLSPVNMRVLSVLAGSDGSVVSRTELFDKVWPNQDVSDDALTRCISDIRATLGKLSDASPFIETIPKKGYRWVHALTEASTHSFPQAASSEITNTTIDLRTWIKWSPLYILALVAMLSASVWVISELSKRPDENIAILPPEPSSQHIHLIESYQNELYQTLLEDGKYKILSAKVVTQNKDAVYPHLYRKFATRWVIESSLSKSSVGNIQVITAIVDARNAFVLERQYTNYAAADILKSKIWMSLEAEKIIEKMSLLSQP